MKTIQELGFQNGYDFAESVLNKNHLIDNKCTNDYIVLVQTSYDGKNWDHDVEFLLSGEYGELEWNNDWWEGQQYVVVAYCIPVTNLLEVSIPEKYWVKGSQLNEE